MAEFFGFEIKRKADAQQQAKDKAKSFVAPMEDDGAGLISGAGTYFGQYVDLDVGYHKSEADLIRRYRDAAQNPECDAAIEDIVNESIVSDSDSAPVSLITDDLKMSDSIKKQITEEFENVVELLNFNYNGHDIYKKWYVDGRLFYHIIVDEKNPKNGILELRPIDPTRIRKVRELEHENDPITGAKIVKATKEYYIYQDTTLSKSNQGVKINKDAVCYT